MFFVQNAGAKAAGTGLHKSAIMQKISLAQAQQVAEATSNGRATHFVDVVTVDADPPIVNPNVKPILLSEATRQADAPILQAQPITRETCSLQVKDKETSISLS